ncbi:glycosyltransferase [Halomonas sp. H5]|uniref:glycosyltransferase n=1 Tax=Halomonas sp. H5 TaxID=3423910 RepID=UPI003D365EFD
MKLEIIMAAYNNEAVMRLVLEGYLLQKDRDFSLCVADDGSGSEIKALVDKFADKGLSVRHVWQEDAGFRKARVVNAAIASSTADYLVMTDNDCIPSAHFVADHKARAKPGHYVAGRRVDLKSSLTDRLLSGDVEVARLNRFCFLVAQARKDGLKRAEVAFRPPSWLARLWSRKPQALLGANFGVWRQDLIGVNGFDRDFEGYGFEESDLEWRLQRYGITSRPVRGRACLFHMYHQERSVSQESLEMLERKRRAGVMFVERGIEDQAIY